MSEKNALKRYRDYLLPQRYGVRYAAHHAPSVYPMHGHDYIEIEYVQSGVMEHELNGEKNILRAGDCYCLDYKALHRFRVLEPVCIHNLCIDYKEAPLAVQRLLHTAELPCCGHIAASQTAQLLAWFAQLETYIQGGTFAEERITAFLLLIVTQILEVCAPITEKSTETGYRHIAKAIDYITQNYAEPLTLTQVAEEAFLSPNYFCKLFAEVSGSTFTAYLTRVRLENAKKRLIETEQPVTQVALECGFGSFAAFSRAFRKVYGCTPTDCRKGFKRE